MSEYISVTNHAVQRFSDRSNTKTRGTEAIREEIRELIRHSDIVSADDINRFYLDRGDVRRTAIEQEKIVRRLIGDDLFICEKIPLGLRVVTYYKLVADPHKRYRTAPEEAYLPQRPPRRSGKRRRKRCYR